MLLNPDAEFDKIRCDGDVIWSKKLRRWLVLSKSAASDVLRDSNFIVYNLFDVFENIQTKTKVDLSDLSRICSWIPFLYDGDRHAALRAVFGRILADLKQDYLNEFKVASASLLADICTRGHGDLAGDYSERLHAETIGRLAGFAKQDRIWLAKTSASQGSIDFAASVQEMVDANDRAILLLDRLDVLVKTLEKTQSFMNRLGKHLNDTGIPDTYGNRLDCMTALILLGRDTLAGTLTVGMGYVFDRSDGHLEAGAWGNPKEITDEFIRLSSTVQISIRVAHKDLVLSGQNIAKGEILMVFLPAANHDPQVFECPHTLQLNQPKHIAFGAGRHLCIGMPLSQSAIKIALTHLSEIKQINLMPGQEMDEGRNTRKLKKLPIIMEN